jgi:hypothetical protein
MHVILKVLLDDLKQLSQGGRIEIHHNVFLELDLEAAQEEEMRKIVRSIHKSAPSRYKQCPRCEGKSFIDDRCCTNCEGTGRVLLRPAIYVGDKVLIKKSIMLPWGWLEYPEPTPVKDRMSIPDGTEGIVVDVVEGVDDPVFTVDMVIDKKLYRILVEEQYVQLSGTRRTHRTQSSTWRSHEHTQR